MFKKDGCKVSQASRGFGTIAISFESGVLFLLSLEDHVLRHKAVVLWCRLLKYVDGVLIGVFKCKGTHHFMPTTILSSIPTARRAAPIKWECVEHIGSQSPLSDNLLVSPTSHITHWEPS